MVEKESSVYLFIGQDTISLEGLSRKHAILEQIKKHFLAKTIEDFNLDILYSKELSLKDLQEKLLCLPLNSKIRIIIIKEAQDLEDDIKEFILSYVKKPQRQIVLVLDMESQGAKDVFAGRISNFAKVYHFSEPARPDAFTLGRSIDNRSTEQALRILNQLLQDGEKPERILGGLRFAFEKGAVIPLEIKKRLKLLLNCDIDIKTGRLKPVFALEKLIVNLCGLGKSFR